jgi:hypothetical protein
MQKTSFSKLEKHSPTRLYMLYPMVQSVALVCVEIDKKLTLQRGVLHSPFSIVIIQKNKISFSVAQLFEF